MGNMIGSGVFLLPASLAPYGWNGVVAWLAAIGGTLLLALVLVCLTRAIPHGGGTTAFVDRAFGPLPAFMIGWGYLAGVYVGIATLAVAAVSYATHLAPALLLGTTPLVAAVALVWLLTALNMRGLRAASGFQLVTLALKILPLLLVLLLAAGALSGGAAEIRPPASGEISLPQVAAAAALVMFAMMGFECASLAAARVERPETTIPRATLIGTGLTGAIYLVVSSAIVLLLPAAELAKSPAPFAMFVARFWSAGPAQLVAAFAVISCIGALNGWVLIGGEMTRDMARRGELPAWFAQTGEGGIPLRALSVGGVAATSCLALNASGSLQQIFEFLLLLSTSTALWLYLACALAAFKLGLSRWLAAAGAIYALATLYGAGPLVSAWSVALMVGGLPLYWLARRHRAVEPVAA